jgi:hypothetical protein
VEVVPASVDDDEVIDLLMMAVGDDPERVDETIQRYRHDPAAVLLLALADSHPVGVVGYAVEGQTIVILHIATGEDIRLTGIGRQMLTAVKAANPGQLRLTAETDNDALGFYLANGFMSESLGQKYPGVERFEVTCRVADNPPQVI